MECLPVTVKYKVNVDGELEPNDPSDQIRKDIFKKTLKPGEVVEITYQMYNPDYSVAQIDKVHKCIRILASEMGEEFNIVKSLVKERSGLKDKSFADCTKEEISSAIQSAISIGDFLGCNLSSY